MVSSHFEHFIKKLSHENVHYVREMIVTSKKKYVDSALLLSPSPLRPRTTYFTMLHMLQSTNQVIPVESHWKKALAVAAAYSNANVGN